METMVCPNCQTVHTVDMLDENADIQTCQYCESILESTEEEQTLNTEENIL
jgi:Zn ribbon nucleic-acid-binding protein